MSNDFFFPLISLSGEESPFLRAWEDPVWRDEEDLFWKAWACSLSSPGSPSPPFYPGSQTTDFRTQEGNFLEGCPTQQDYLSELVWTSAGPSMNACSACGKIIIRLRCVVFTCPIRTYCKVKGDELSGMLWGCHRSSSRQSVLIFTWVDRSGAAPWWKRPGAPPAWLGHHSWKIYFLKNSLI